MLIYCIAGLFFIWLVVLSFVVFKTKSHYTRLTKRTKGGQIDEVLDAILQHDELFKKNLNEIGQELEKVKDKSRFYFQKLGMVRFNPYGRAHGDQSFVLALLDEEGRGVVLNFIYTHEGIRVYTKKVKDSKSDEFELSEEEKRAIKIALER